MVSYVCPVGCDGQATLFLKDSPVHFSVRPGLVGCSCSTMWHVSRLANLQQGYAVCMLPHWEDMWLFNSVSQLLCCCVVASKFGWGFSAAVARLSDEVVGVLLWQFSTTTLWCCFCLDLSRPQWWCRDALGPPLIECGHSLHVDAATAFCTGGSWSCYAGQYGKQATRRLCLLAAHLNMTT